MLTMMKMQKLQFVQSCSIRIKIHQLHLISAQQSLTQQEAINIAASKSVCETHSWCQIKFSTRNNFNGLDENLLAILRRKQNNHAIRK